MNQRKRSGAAKRLVWRITEAAPLGEFVDPDAHPPAGPAAEDEDSGNNGGWMVSSFELMHGAEISENPDTVPDALFDELFAPPPKAPPNPDGNDR